jgi:hypothetical protein
LVETDGPKPAGRTNDDSFAARTAFSACSKHSRLDAIDNGIDNDLNAWTHSLDPLAFLLSS